MAFYDDALDEGPDETDADLLGDEADEPEQVECPSCAAMIHEDSPKCPYCGEWVVGRTEAARRAGTWVWPVLIVLLILGMIMIFSR